MSQYAKETDRLLVIVLLLKLKERELRTERIEGGKKEREREIVVLRCSESTKRKKETQLNENK
jgi:hypothetical protein